MTSICLIVQNVYDIDPRVRRKAEALVAAGHTVDVMALARPDGKKTYSLNGVTVHTISLGKDRGSIFRYMYEYAAFFTWVLLRLPLLMRRQRYSVVDVNTLPDFLVFAAVPARWMGAKLILDMHEITPEFYMSKYGVAENSWLIWLLKYLEKISFDCADYVIAINEPILDLLVGRGLTRSKTVVVMNAVDEINFNLGAGPRAEEQRENTFVMMYHGTLTGIYGLDIAVQAFNLVHTDMPGAEVWILGSGPEKRVLDELVQKQGLASNIKLLGRVPSEDIPSWLNKCDVGILPIRRDVFLDFAFPNKLPEFIIMGKAVLMSRLKAIRHYFSEDALAYFEPNNAEDLAKQMVRLYNDRPLRAQLAAKAKREYEPIRWELMKQRYLKLIEDAEGSIPIGAQRPNPNARQADAIGRPRETAEGSHS